jgi:hypothetical protein
MEGQIRRIVLFYNDPYPGMIDGIHECNDRCTFTTDRTLLSQAKAVVFHVPTLGNLALPRKHNGQQWVAWSMESKVNYPALAEEKFLRRFDITMTYERAATVWCPYFGPDTADQLLRFPQPKTEQAPVVYFRSSPLDRSGRGRYAFELMKRVKVDSYGQILKNRQLLDDDCGSGTRLATLSRYKFTLAFENSIAIDYVTEKFFEPLIAGSVPIYLGAPNISEFAPAERCFINVADFDGPSSLASYLNSLDCDPGAYDAYLSWKARGLSSGFRKHIDVLRASAFNRLCNALS